MTRTQAQAAGREARFARLPSSANPFPTFSANGRAWNDGWQEIDRKLASAA